MLIRPTDIAEDLLHRLDALVLLLSNLSIIVGVVALGWSLQTIVMTYWAETAVLGVAALFQIARTQGKAATFLVPFFTVHMGIFMFVHLVFLSVLLIGEGEGGGASGFMGGNIVGALGYISPLGLAALAAGHFIGAMLSAPTPPTTPVADRPKPGSAKAVNELMGSVLGGVYGRIAAMQVTIIIGGAIAMFLGSPIFMLVLLVVFKIVIELGVVSLTTKPTTEPSTRLNDEPGIEQRTGENQQGDESEDGQHTDERQ